MAKFIKVSWSLASQFLVNMLCSEIYICIQDSGLIRQIYLSYVTLFSICRRTTGLSCKKLQSFKLFVQCKLAESRVRDSFSAPSARAPQR